MADKHGWIEEALDAWLSPEAGTGPEGDEGWRERTGYFKSALEAREGEGAAASAPPAEPGPEAPQDWLAEGYEEQRAALRTAMTGFMSRLLYAFPDRNAMTIDDIAAAGGWIADMERQVRIAQGWALLHRIKGRPELGREADAAFAELGQLKEAYALQRRRIGQREQARIEEINRDTAAFVREQEAKRRELARDTDLYIDRLRRQTDREQQRLRDEQHRDFVRYLRGERVFEIREL